MEHSRFERIQALLEQTADLPAAEQRAYLDAECSGDGDLLAEVLAMLREDENRASFLERSLPEIANCILNAPPLPPDPNAFAPYRITRLLGEGGMGVVYLAERPATGGQAAIPVAIKVLRDGLLSPARRERFLLEQNLLVRLNHPLIARIYDAPASPASAPWFVMEYVDGLPITDYCRQSGSGVDEILRLFRSVCEAVDYAHSRAITHRDLKPSNILVTPEGLVKLLDFGIAKQAEENAPPEHRITQTGLRPMTVAYAPPEQIRGEDTTNQADVYSLGVILYELLAGAPPFDLSKVSQGEAERIVLAQDPPPPSTAGRKRPRNAADRIDWRDLDVLCLTSMQKDQARRYPSVEALIRDIDHYRKGEPLEARPDTLRYRAGKFIRRNGRAVLAVAAALLLIGALAAFFAVRLNQERNATLAEGARAQRIEQFMLNLFDGGDKAAAPANDLRVIAVLDRGVANARTLAADPAVQAELYQTLGGIYQKLGRFDRADALMLSALERRKSIGGPESSEVADGLVALGLLRLDQGRMPEAEQRVREGLAMQQKFRRPFDPAVSRGVFALGKVLSERGKNEEAIRVMEPAVNASRANTPDLALGLSNLAGAQFYLGHYPEAKALELRALALDRQFFGAVHPRVSDVLMDMGQIDQGLGRLPEMEKDIRQALAIRQAWYGTEHPDTAMSLLGLAQALYYEGESHYPEAAALAEQGVAIQSRLLGSNNPELAQGLSVLGTLQLKLGQLGEAQATTERVLAIDRTLYGERHNLVGIAWMNLGEVCFARNQAAAGEKAYREALASFTAVLPPGHVYTAVARTRLGHALLMEKRYKEAEENLLAGYGTLTKQPNPSAARTVANARKDLAALYIALRQPQKAAPYK